MATVSFRTHSEQPAVWSATPGGRVRLMWFTQPYVGNQGPRKNSGSHIDASHSRQPLVKGERLVRYEVNAVMLYPCKSKYPRVNTEERW